MKKTWIFRNMRKIAIFLFVLVLASPLLLYTVLMLGWPPVVGNLTAAHALRTYAAGAHPDWAPVGHWADYNLVDEYYYLEFTEGGETHNLRYGFGGMVSDREREDALREELGIDRALRLGGLGHEGIYWSAGWDPQEPETARIRLRVDFYDDADAPVLAEEPMREKMADRMLEVYDVLSPLAEVDWASVYYCHQGVKGKDVGLVWNIIQVDLDKRAELTRDAILTAPLAVK